MFSSNGAAGPGRRRASRFLAVFVLLRRVPPAFSNPLTLLWVTAVGFAGLIVFVGGLAGPVSSQDASLFGTQCSAAVGASPTSGQPPVAQAQAIHGARDTINPSDMPTSNPYAELKPEPGSSQYERDCLAAMKVAHFQLPLLQTRSASVATACARQLATSIAGMTPADAVRALGKQSEPQSSSGVMRLIIQLSSAASFTGRCDQGEDPAAPGSCTGTGAYSPTPTAISLPDTIAKQALCGQGVDPSATSPGDLVFWDYMHDAANREAVAIGDTEILTQDPSSGRFTLGTMPAGTDVRVKRVLAQATSSNAR